MMRRRRGMTPDRAAHLPASAGHVRVPRRRRSAPEGLTLTFIAPTRGAQSCFVLSSLRLKRAADCWPCKLNPRHGSEPCGLTLALYPHQADLR
eukprot:10917472-Lingulodinium_polyedra.AAC.1